MHKCIVTPRFLSLIKIISEYHAKFQSLHSIKPLKIKFMLIYNVLLMLCQIASTKMFTKVHMKGAKLAVVKNLLVYTDMKSEF